MHSLVWGSLSQRGALGLGPRSHEEQVLLAGAGVGGGGSESAVSLGVGSRKQDLLQERWAQTCWVWLPGVPGAVPVLPPHTCHCPPSPATGHPNPEATLPQSLQATESRMVGWAWSPETVTIPGSPCSPSGLSLLYFSSCHLPPWYLLEFPCI